MLKLYDNPEELTFPDDEISDNVESDDKSGDKLAINDKNGDKLAIKQMIVDKMAITTAKNADKMAINDHVVDKMADIIMYLESHPQSTSSAIAKLIDLQISSAKNYLTRLVKLDFVVARGANKNRTYSLTQDILILVRRGIQPNN